MLKLVRTPTLHRFVCFVVPWLQQQLRQQRLLQRTLSVIKQSKPSSTGSILSSAIGFYASHATMLAAAVIGEWSSHSPNMVHDGCIIEHLLCSLHFTSLSSINPLLMPSLPPFLLSSFLLSLLSLSLSHSPFLPPSLVSLVLSRHTSRWENNGSCWNSCHGYSRGTEENSSYL